MEGDRHRQQEDAKCGALDKTLKKGDMLGAVKQPH